jgi:hypothetical protein
MNKHVPKEFTLVLDRGARTLDVATATDSTVLLPLQEFVAENGKSKVLVAWGTDGLPIVDRVQILDERKVAILQDWITEAVASAIGERWDDDYTYGVDLEY